MTTVELILSGLLLVSLPREQQRDVVVVFPRDEVHSFHLVLLKGELDDECAGWSSDPPRVRTFSNPRDLRLSLAGMEGLDMTEVVSFLPKDRVPRTAAEAASLTWVPRLTPMVMGESRLIRPCEDSTQSCDGAAARLFLDRGRLTSCHLVHMDEHGDPDKPLVRLYKLPSGQISALADAVSVEQTWDGDHVDLAVGDTTCRVMAEKGQIQLLVGNVPPQKHTVSVSAHAEHSGGRVRNHFPRLHDFSRRIYQRMDRSRPIRLDEQRIDLKLIGSCEDEIRVAQSAIGALFSTAVVHSPSECGTGQQP